MVSFTATPTGRYAPRRRPRCAGLRRVTGRVSVAIGRLGRVGVPVLRADAEATLRMSQRERLVQPSYLSRQELHRPMWRAFSR